MKMECRSFSFLILNRAGKIGLETGYKVLQMTENPETKSLYEKISNSMEEIKFKNVVQLIDTADLLLDRRSQGLLHGDSI